MRVLVTWGSKRGGTEGIAHIIADTLEEEGFDVVAVPADDASNLDTFDAVIVGGALYAFRWPATVRRFVNRNVKALRKVPVWFFSSGPLDDSAEREQLPPPTQVAILAERVGAKEHMMFGGRLTADAKGFPASAMAKENAGDWRNPDRIRAWTEGLARELPMATPGEAVDQPGRSITRLVTHGVVGWLLCAAIMILTAALSTGTAALIVHAIAVPLVFAALAANYFRARGARDPLPTAVTWMVVFAALDLVLMAGVVQRSMEMFTSIAGTWLPFLLVFLATWGVGVMMSMRPWEPREVPAGTPA